MAGLGFPFLNWRAAFLALPLVLPVLLLPAAALAQEAAEQPRPVRFEWDRSGQRLYLAVAFRDAIDASVRAKLGRGLPTTIVLTGAIYPAGATQPVSTTAQTCKITWHVWQEVYIVEISRPGETRTDRTLTINGVLRRCAEIDAARTSRLLLAGTRAQVPFGVPLYLEAKVQINPISREVLQKIQRWVSRPKGTGTAAPGDALFSTFTGLFLQRIGTAERELKFTTRAVMPSVEPMPKAPPQ